MSGRQRSERSVYAALFIGLAMISAGCTSDDAPDVAPTAESTDAPGAGSAVLSTPGDGTDSDRPCSPELGETPPEWPYTVPDSMIATAFTDDDGVYSAFGVTEDAEAVLVEALEQTFPDYDVSEPTGGALDLSVEFTSLSGDASLVMNDDDADGCWDVTILANLLGPTDDASEQTGDATEQTGENVPETTATPATTAAAPPATLATDPLGDLASVGVGQVTTARGTFSVSITSCRFSPTEIDGQGDAGTLRILSSIDSTVSVSWTYADDGVEVRDDDARVLATRGESGSYVADGENQEGPETIIAEVTC